MHRVNRQYKLHVVQDAQGLSDSSASPINLFVVPLQGVIVYGLSELGLSTDRPIQGSFFSHFSFLSGVAQYHMFMSYSQVDRKWLM